MAIFKQGQVNQVLAVMVDKTNFASVESGVTSGFTCTLYTYKQNSSDATSAVTLSRAPSVVRSGIFRVVVKSTETSGVDNALLKIAHASCADQYIPISFQAQDISDAISNVDSALTSQYSNIISRVPKEVAARSQLSDLASDLKSYLAGMSGAISDIDSAVSSQYSDLLSTVGSQFAVVSNYLSNASNYLSNISAVLSDVRSNVSDLQSDFQSRVPKAVATASRLLLLESVASDAHSAAAQANSRALVMQSTLSDIDSAVSSQYSDLASKVGNISVTLTASDISDIASATAAAIEPAAIGASDISDIASAVWAYATRKLTSLADVSLCASDMSDLRSAITAGGGALTESNISDIASAVWAHGTAAQINSRVLLAESMASDAHSAAAQANSRALVLQSSISDIDSALTSQFTKGQSDLSDIYSLLTAGVTVGSSSLSDIRSAISDYGSKFASDIKSAIAAGVPISASDMSDIRSAITAKTFDLSASDMSDIRSAILSLSGIISDAHSAAAQANSRALVIQSTLSDIDSAMTSQFNSISNAVSDAHSDIYSLLGAVKTKTDGLTFTVAGQVDANIQYVNDVQVTGTGASGAEWGPA